MRLLRIAASSLMVWAALACGGCPPVPDPGLPATCDDLPEAIDFGVVTVDDEARMDIAGVVTGFSGDAEERLAFTLAPGDDGRTTVVFSPREARSYTVIASVRAGPSCDEEEVRLTGVGVDAVLTWEPATVACGMITPGASISRTVTFSNAGTREVALTGLSAGHPAVTLDTGGDDPTQVTVPPNGTAALTVTCRPEALGAGQATITLSTPLAQQPTVAIPVEWFGGGPDIQVTPSLLSFGNVAYLGVDTQVHRRTLTVMNVGTPGPGSDPRDNLHLGAPDGQGGRVPPYAVVTPLNETTDASEFSIVVPPGYDPAVGLAAEIGDNLLELTVELRPTTAGTKRAEIAIPSNDVDEPVVKVIVEAEVVMLPSCNYALSTGRVSFGLIDASRIWDREITLTNLGTSPDEVCYVGGPVLASSGSTLFSLPDAGGGGVKELGPGESLNVIVRATVPAPTPAGITHHDALIEFDVSSAIAPTARVEVTAQVGPVCLMRAPETLDFGTVKPGCRSETRSVALYDRCGTQVTVSSVTLACTGSACADFQIVDGPPAGTVIADPVVPTVQVQYVPGDTGEDTAFVVINGTQSGNPVSWMIPLTGRGDPGGLHHQTFTLPAQRMADVLIVTDSSQTTMQSWQQAWGTNFASFIQHAQQAQVDFRIAVTTTDPNGGQFISGAQHPDTILTASTPNLSSQFAAKIVQGGTGNPDPHVADAAVRALTAPLIETTNAGFLRSDAALAIIGMSEITDKSPRTASYYLDGLLNLKGHDRRHLFGFSAFMPVSTPCPLMPQPLLSALVAQTGGMAFDACTSDLPGELEDLGRVAFGGPVRWFLTSTPDWSAANITVKVNGTTLTSGWTWDPLANAIEFFPLSAPEPGDTLDITYAPVCIH